MAESKAVKLDRIMIAAPKSGSGKTMITCALLAALQARGKKVFSCKCGPDYIDPMFHRTVLGVASKNLDTFFTGEQKTAQLLFEDRESGDFAVLEGVMGLFDGLSGIREEGSSYHLAKVTKTPIVLVVDAKGAGRSVIPLVLGFLAYDKERLIRGIVLNRMTQMYYEKIKPVMEEEIRQAGFEAKLLGCFPEQKELQVGSRHLGLMMPEEMTDLRSRIRSAAARLEQSVDVAGVIRIAEEAAETDEAASKDKSAPKDKTMESAQIVFPSERPRIAVARDEAFCFYYAENLRLLEECGARLCEFSPLRDEALPDGISGILLGGGYPELHAEKLSRNHSMKAAVRRAAAAGMPMVAECGGFMYLHRFLTDEKNTRHEMAGVLPGEVRYTGKLVRFGYIELCEKTPLFLPEGDCIKGHEFHYYDSTDNGEACTAKKPGTDQKYTCVVSGSNQWFGFPHLYYPSDPAFAERFVKMANMSASYFS